MVDKEDPWKSKSKPISPTNLFGFSIFGGITAILLGTWLNSFFLNIIIPVGIMLYYAYTVNKDKSDSLSIEQKADSVYYMGFILTLVAMTASLVALAYDDELRFNAVVINFGLALATTILGLAIRIIWIQLSSKSLSDAESILKERIIRRSQDLQDQTEKVVGSMTALSNQLSKVAEPLQSNFERLTKTMDINEGINNKLRLLDQSADTAAQSLRIIASLTESMAVSTLELKKNIDEGALENIKNLNTSANQARPKISELNSEITTSIDSIHQSLELLQKNIKKTDEMIAFSQANLEKNSIFKKAYSKLKDFRAYTKLKDFIALNNLKYKKIQKRFSNDKEDPWKS